MTKTPYVGTPASKGSVREISGEGGTFASFEKLPSVAVFGAGIAGLTAAHELAERGFKVFVFEQNSDERQNKLAVPNVEVPPVKLGGLAASQYATSNEPDDAAVEASSPTLRTFPSLARSKAPMPPSDPSFKSQLIPGEHGFRFFPAYYMHLWDMLQRIPIYQARVADIPRMRPLPNEFAETLGGMSETMMVRWVQTDRTVYDNVRRVTTQAITTPDGRPSLIIPRTAPQTFAEWVGQLAQYRELGFTQTDIYTFMSRMLRYMVTSPERRAEELEGISAYDFFVGRDPETGIHSVDYTAEFDLALKQMPKVLAAFDAQWGDARTNLSTFIQLHLPSDRADDKVDGVLNGPTTESWFDHWYIHLTKLGVEFRLGSVDRLRVENGSMAFDLDLKLNDLTQIPGVSADLEGPLRTALKNYELDHYLEEAGKLHQPMNPEDREREEAPDSQTQWLTWGCWGADGEPTSPEGAIDKIKERVKEEHSDPGLMHLALVDPARLGPHLQTSLRDAMKEMLEGRLEAICLQSKMDHPDQDDTAAIEEAINHFLKRRGDTGDGEDPEDQIKTLQAVTATARYDSLEQYSGETLEEALRSVAARRPHRVAAFDELADWSSRNQGFRRLRHVAERAESRSRSWRDAAFKILNVPKDCDRYDYVVLALDARQAELVTARMRSGTESDRPAGAIEELGGFFTARPPAASPRSPRLTRTQPSARQQLFHMSLSDLRREFLQRLGFRPDAEPPGGDEGPAADADGNGGAARDGAAVNMGAKALNARTVKRFLKRLDRRELLVLARAWDVPGAEALSAKGLKRALQEEGEARLVLPHLQAERELLLERLDADSLRNVLKGWGVRSLNLANADENQLRNEIESVWQQRTRATRLDEFDSLFDRTRFQILQELLPPADRAMRVSAVVGPPKDGGDSNEETASYVEAVVEMILSRSEDATAAIGRVARRFVDHPSEMPGVPDTEGELGKTRGESTKRDLQDAVDAYLMESEASREVNPEEWAKHYSALSEARAQVRHLTEASIAQNPRPWVERLSEVGPSDLRAVLHRGIGIKEVGVEKWDRFQTLAGIQYFFDTEFQLVSGHIYYSGTEWAITSINQTGLWERQPNVHHSTFASILSVDIGDWNTPSVHLADEAHPHGKAARECTADEIAYEVWRQMISALANDTDRAGHQVFPEPVWYSLDRYIKVDAQTGQVRENAAPYLVPIVDDWHNRPGGYPWNPQGRSTAYVREDRDQQAKRHVWMADHGGYEVYLDKLVLAGTWTKTFTRMTTMESACESARHAVNAILDHWVFAHSNETDSRTPQSVGLGWRWPRGFLDQSGLYPIRQPTPAGDYCFVFDMENREWADLRPTRILDERLVAYGLQHPWDLLGIDSLSTMMAKGGGLQLDPKMPIDPFSPAHLRWMTGHMQNWRKVLDALGRATDPDDDFDRMIPYPEDPDRNGPPGWIAILPTEMTGAQGEV